MKKYIIPNTECAYVRALGVVMTTSPGSGPSGAPPGQNDYSGNPFNPVRRRTPAF